MIIKGWKDIAKHLGCGLRTVQRWEKLSLPVRRPAKGKRAAVVAVSEELDAWLRRRSPIEDESVSSEAIATQARPFRHRILLADDNEGLLVSLAARLSAEGYDVRTARDGFEALALMREAAPDVLVSDLKMPTMSGFELFSVVRQRFPAVAVIAHTGEFIATGNLSLLCDRRIEKGRNSGVELQQAVRELLSQSPLRAQPARVDVAPVWIPRSMNGYFVLTCRDCLRSFSVLTRDGVIGEDAVAKCTQCGEDVKYHIDDSVLPIKDDLTELLHHSRTLRSTRGGGGEVQSSEPLEKIGAAQVTAGGVTCQAGRLARTPLVPAKACQSFFLFKPEPVKWRLLTLFRPAGAGYPRTYAGPEKRTLARTSRAGITGIRPPKAPRTGHGNKPPARSEV